MGGNAGEVNYPVHIRMAHQDMLFGTTAKPPVEDFEGPDDYPAALNYNVMTDIDAARTTLGVNPHTNASAYDPDIALQVVTERSQALYDKVDMINPMSDISSYMGAAKALIDDGLLDQAKIDDAVDSFDRASKTRFKRRSTAMAAGLFDIRATMTSTFGQAMALAESEREDTVAEYDKSLRNGYETQRAALAIDVVDKMLRSQALQQQTLMQSAQVAEISNRNKIIAKQDQINFDLGREVDDQMWDLNLYSHFNQTMSSVNGLASGLPGPTELERGLALAATGVSVLGTLASFF